MRLFEEQMKMNWQPIPLMVWIYYMLMKNINQKDGLGANIEC
jgi:hypothetical protein